MKRLRKNNVVYLLIAAMTLSSWSGLASACGAESSATLAAVATVSTLHHAGAVDTQHAAHQSPDMHHQSTGADDVTFKGCTNCADCVASCSMAGGSVMVNAPLLVDTPINISDDPISSVTEFRSSPPPHSLFRPPIFGI